MADSATLHSKLRILIAKTFRAEKLYSSLRNPSSQAATNDTKLAEMANELRAKEWQRSHTLLRTSLNDILDIKKTAEVAEEVATLYQSFINQAHDSSKKLDKTLQALVESGKKEEFVHSLKLSFELIRLKAQMQANHAISDELGAIIHGKNPSIKTSLKVQSDVPLGEDLEEVNSPISNVVPLRKKFSSGR